MFGEAGNGHSLRVEDGVSRRDSIETSRPILGFATRPQAFLLFLLAVVSAERRKASEG